MAKEQILIVEDEFIVARDIQNCLKNMGYAVADVTSTGEQAIQKAAIARPDLVLMDINLAGDMDGIAATQEIRRRFNIPVVYLTSYADEDTLARAKTTEPYGYIVKPFDDAELRAVVEMAIHKHKAEIAWRVTERKHAAEEARVIEERFHRIFESSNDGIFVLDPSGDKILDANPKACSMLGYSREELLSMKVSAIHPDEMPQLMAFAQSVYEQGSGWTDELTCMTKTGEALPAEISASMVDIQGLLCMIATVRDISERKETEAALLASNQELERRVRELGALNSMFQEHLRSQDEDPESLGKFQ